MKVRYRVKKLLTLAKSCQWRISIFFPYFSPLDIALKLSLWRQPHVVQLVLSFTFFVGSRGKNLAEARFKLALKVFSHKSLFLKMICFTALEVEQA